MTKKFKSHAARALRSGFVSALVLFVPFCDVPCV